MRDRVVKNQLNQHSHSDQMRMSTKLIVAHSDQAYMGPILTYTYLVTKRCNITLNGEIDNTPSFEEKNHMGTNACLEMAKKIADYTSH